MKICRILSLLVILVLALCCEDPVPDPQPEPPIIAPSAVTLNKTALTLLEGESETLTATVKPDNATNKNVIWSSSNASIASVANGVVTGKKEGTATITAKAGEKEATCVVTVKKKVIDVSDVTLNKNELSLVEGDSETLTATVKPDNATDKTVTWRSSNAAIATVENGKVTAIKEGSATITAKAGEKEAKCVVTVSKKVIAVTEVTLNLTNLSLFEGESQTLTATVKPDNATDKTVTWRSSNAVVATVDNGKVTAVKEGTATITAKAGEKEAMCVVTVKKKVIDITEVTLNLTNLSLFEGESQTLTATVKPDNATDKTVTWSSSNAAVATVDNGKVTAVKEGTATITAKAGEKEAKCVVTVKKKTIAVTEVTLNKNELSLEEGESETLTATVKPDNASDKTVTWSSSNAAVATVEKGKVTAVKEGTAIISAKAGNVTATCNVTVKNIIHISYFELEKSAITLNKGGYCILVAQIYPQNAEESLTWSSSDKAVATVDQTGKVTAIGVGTATITAKAGRYSGYCERKCVVTVIDEGLGIGIGDWNNGGSIGGTPD